MVTVDELKQNYKESKEEAKMKFVINIIEQTLKEVPFKKGYCEKEFNYKVVNHPLIKEYFEKLGYSCQVLWGDNKTAFILSWNTATEDDRYYITNSTHPSGSFVVARIDPNLEADICGQMELGQMQRWGNYFNTREEAKQVCDQFNSLLRERKANGDKNS